MLLLYQGLVHLLHERIEQLLPLLAVQQVGLVGLAHLLLSLVEVFHRCGFPMDGSILSSLVGARPYHVTLHHVVVVEKSVFHHYHSTTLSFTFTLFGTSNV